MGRRESVTLRLSLSPSNARFAVAKTRGEEHGWGHGTRYLPVIPEGPGISAQCVVAQLLFQNLYATWHQVQELLMKVFESKVTVFIVKSTVDLSFNTLTWCSLWSSMTSIKSLQYFYLRPTTLRRYPSSFRCSRHPRC